MHYDHLLNQTKLQYLFMDPFFFFYFKGLLKLKLPSANNYVVMRSLTTQRRKKYKQLGFP